MEQISVVIITFNEQENLPACLQAAQQIADEIIIIDSFSTDRTPEICHQFGANYVAHVWEGYSASKNYGNSLARFQWILSLDADEVLSDELIQQIKSFKSHPSGDAYSMNRLTNYLGKWIRHGGWYPDVKVRLWRKDQAFWLGDVHEQLILNDDLHVHHLKGDLLHYSIPSLSVHRKQIHKYSDIWAESSFRSGKMSSVLSLIFKPLARFLSTYLIKLGVLDGKEGFLIAVMSAYSVFLRHSKLRYRWRKLK
jgi:glycosyltransferase involved in cell wall biosynthesis